MSSEASIQVVDSHTEGEPTRVVIGGAPDLGGGTMRERLERLREQHDWLRTTCVLEPRGADAVVGALLCEPDDAANDVGVIFFNNTGYLQMCGHGTIGVIETLRHLGRLSGDSCRIETSVGVVVATRREDGAVSVENVRSWRFEKDVTIDVDGRAVTGDIAWGGNWFFLTKDVGVKVVSVNIRELTDVCLRIRKALEREGITGKDGGELDHIEIFGPPTRTDADSKNFVLCPGGAYDRSPCGTGTSAKMACLFADGQLKAGEIWRQESIIGSVFEGVIDERDGELVPTITGRAYLTAESTLIAHPEDPFRHGITP